MLDLTLPGTFPGLLTPGSPVRLLRDLPLGSHAQDLPPLPKGTRGMVISQTTGDIGPIVVLGLSSVLPVACEDLLLDLERPLGLHRAACWLVERKLGAASPGPGAMPSWCVGWSYKASRSWVLSGQGRSWGFTSTSGGYMLAPDQETLPSRWQIVGSLAGVLLQPAPPAKGPHRDRDADALRRVCLYVEANHV